MIHIKNKLSINKMAQAGRLLSEIFNQLTPIIRVGIGTAEIDALIERALADKGLISMTKGYMGYQHVSCISVNDEVVHGVPESNKILQDGDVVKIDVCASWKSYCADMARSFFVGTSSCAKAQKLVSVVQQALNMGIQKARAGNKLSDISAAIQQETERHGFGVVRDFAGHGIGKNMHEEPEVLNYGKPDDGPVLQPGMALAIEPMITMGKYEVYVTSDGWTVKTVDKSLAAHVEDTIVVTNGEPMILTRNNRPLQESMSAR